MKNTLHDVTWDGIVRACFADAGRQDKAKNSGARLLVGAHGVEQSRGWNARPGRQRSQAANERDDTRDVGGTRQAEFVAKEGCSSHAPGHGFTELVAAVVHLGCLRLSEGRNLISGS